MAEFIQTNEYDERVLGPFTSDVLPIEPMAFEDPRRDFAHRLEYLAMRATLGTVSRLPRFVREGIVGSLARVSRLYDRRHSAAAAEFIRTAQPDLPEDEVKAGVLEAWRHLFRVALVAERIPRKLMGRRLGDHYEVHLGDEARGVLESEAGCLLVTLHLGFWEAAGLPLMAMGFRPMVAVGKAPRNHYTAQHIARAREIQGGLLLPRKGAMKGVPAVVRAGGAALMLLDHRARQKPVMAPFFGREAPCDRSAAVLVRRVGAPVVLFACTGIGPERYRLQVGPVIHPEDLEGLRPEGVAARLNREYESLILGRPRQYFWLHDRYRGGRPAPQAATPSKVGDPAP